MSAIYGLVGNADLSLLKSMGDRLTHRGAVNQEWSPAPGVFLGQRDFDHALGAEHQNTRPVVTNASIYNKDQILETLHQQGLHPGESDPALMEAAYQAFGLDGFALLNGDFVVAIWNAGDGSLILARDPLGVRSLYFYQGSDFFAFASEYKALLAIDSVPASPDLDAIQYLNASKYLPPGKTLLEDVHALRAGHWLCLKEGQSEQLRYWDITLAEKDLAEDVAIEQVKKLFLDSMARRMQGVDQLGVALSGGIDSSAVVAAMDRLRPGETISTFTIGSGEDDPEIVMARKIVEQYGTRHHEYVVNPEDLVADLPAFIWHLEDPVGRTEGYLYYKLMQLSPNGIPIVFGGSASDGLFAGMPKHKLVKMMQMFPLGRGYLEEFYQYTQVSSPPQTLFGKIVNRLYFGNSELPAPGIKGAAPMPAPSPFPKQRAGLMNQVLRAGVLEGVQAWMPKIEKTHMAYGVEFRSPFTDSKLIQYAFEIPERLKMKGFQEKYVLRQALKSLLPKEVAQRPKFPQRMGYDLKLSEVLDTLADIYLSPKAIQQRGFFKASEIEALRVRTTGSAYSDNRAMRLWTAIMTELWAQTFLDRRGSQASS
jgi:asparagine synthase (glutamine-hydrolysing)